MKSQQLKYNGKRASITKTIIGLLIGITLLNAFSKFMDYQLLQQKTIDLRQLGANDLQNWLLGNTYFLGLLLLTYFFVRWFRRAYHNLHLLGAELSFDERWATWSWFVPVLNLFRPYKIMEEIWEQSAKLSRHQRVNYWLLGAWWASFLVSYLLSHFSSQLMLRAQNIRGVHLSNLLEIFADLSAIPGMVLLFLLIHRISKLEDKLIRIYHRPQLEAHLLKGAA